MSWFMVKWLDFGLTLLLLFFALSYLSILLYADLKRLLPKKFRLNPLNDTVSKLDNQKDNCYQNYDFDPEHNPGSPRVFIKPVFDNSIGNNDKCQNRQRSKKFLAISFRYVLFLPKICIRVYRLFKRQSTITR